MQCSRQTLSMTLVCCLVSQKNKGEAGTITQWSKTFASHATDLDLISDIPYGPPKTKKHCTDSWVAPPGLNQHRFSSQELYSPYVAGLGKYGMGVHPWPALQGPHPLSAKNTLPKPLAL